MLSFGMLKKPRLVPGQQRTGGTQAAEKVGKKQTNTKFTLCYNGRQFWSNEEQRNAAGNGQKAKAPITLTTSRGLAAYRLCSEDRRFKFIKGRTEEPAVEREWQRPIGCSAYSATARLVDHSCIQNHIQGGC